MHPSVESKRAEIAAACREFGVLRLAVFGSVARGDFQAERSDVDFLVEVSPDRLTMADYFALRERLANIVGRPVDLIDDRALKNPSSALRSIGPVNSSSRRDPRAYLWDAIVAAQHIATFVAQRTADDYLKDVLLRSATERQLEIIGEALNALGRIDPAIRSGSRICATSSGCATS